MMSDFWTMVGTWSTPWQWTFFAAFFSGAMFTVMTLGWYVAVLFRGWPPPHVMDEKD